MCRALESARIETVGWLQHSLLLWSPKCPTLVHPLLTPSTTWPTPDSHFVPHAFFHDLIHNTVHDNRVWQSMDRVTVT